MARTLTLAEDVEARLIAEAERKGTGPDELANEVLRRGLDSASAPRRKFVVRARDLGARPDVNFDCSWTLLDEIDGTTTK